MFNKLKQSTTLILTLARLTSPQELEAKHDDRLEVITNTLGSNSRTRMIQLAMDNPKNKSDSILND